MLDRKQKEEHAEELVGSLFVSFLPPLQARGMQMQTALLIKHCVLEPLPMVLLVSFYLRKCFLFMWLFLTV